MARLPLLASAISCSLVRCAIMPSTDTRWRDSAAKSVAAVVGDDAGCGWRPQPLSAAMTTATVSNTDTAIELRLIGCHTAPTLAGQNHVHVELVMRPDRQIQGSAHASRRFSTTIATTNTTATTAVK